MEKKITFNELRKIKDSLPDGAIRKMAKEFDVSAETVRNYFGGANYTDGAAVGIHMEPGPNGGIVLLDDSRMLDRAKEILEAV
ncbi:MAG: DNA-binding protein [Draconibacterium sp.]|nr:DNA-binding protein [Draconibacterium sp.]